METPDPPFMTPRFQGLKTGGNLRPHLTSGVFLIPPWVFYPFQSVQCCRDSLSIASDSVLHGAGPRNRGQASSGQQSMQYLGMVWRGCSWCRCLVRMQVSTCQVQWEVKLKMFFFAVKSWGGWVNSHPAVQFHIPRDVFVWSQESEGSRSDETTTDMAQACTTNKVFSYQAVEFPHARWIMFLQTSSLYKFKGGLATIGMVHWSCISPRCISLMLGIYSSPRADRFTPVVHWFCV